MSLLSGQGKYEITPKMKENLKDFYGNYASEEKTAAAIKDVYFDNDYIMDTHTAVAYSVYKEYKETTGDTTKTIIASTASPFKFTRSVMNAIDKKYETLGDFELVDELSKLGQIKVPNAIEEIRTAPVVHNNQCDAADMKATVEKYLGI